jgi:hypothetical protein
VPTPWSCPVKRLPPELQGVAVRRCGRVPLRAFLLGDPVAEWTHYVEEDGGGGRAMGRTRPCCHKGPEAAAECPYCPRGKRCYFYAPAVTWDPDPKTGRTVRVRVVLELTARAAEALDGRVCRGLALELRRQGPHRNGPVTAKVYADEVPPADLPEAFDVAPILGQLWGVVPPAAAADKPARTIPFRRPG